MTDYLEAVGFFHKCQFGFRHGLNCECAILDLVESIRYEILNGRDVLVAFEDF